jgi:hypothetical protein
MPGRLPAPTSFVGREDELKLLDGLLETSLLVTLNCMDEVSDRRRSAKALGRFFQFTQDRAAHAVFRRAVGARTNDTRPQRL